MNDRMNELFGPAMGVIGEFWDTYDSDHGPFGQRMETFLEFASVQFDKRMRSSSETTARASPRSSMPRSQTLRTKKRRRWLLASRGQTPAPDKRVVRVVRRHDTTSKVSQRETVTRRLGG